MFEFSVIDKVLNMYDSIHSTRSLYKLIQVNEYLLRDKRIQNPVKDLKWSVWKNNYSF